MTDNTLNQVSHPFSDHFKTVARHYAENRPCYPVELFEWLAEQCPVRDLAWDCGTGSGQAAIDLATYFASVLATDASPAQISQAQAHDRVEYRVAAADISELESCTVDLVVVAQALHWFDVDQFHQEVQRVLKPKGIIAEWCYGIIEVEDEAINRLIQHFYHNVVGAYWPPERKHVETAYRDLPFPFHPIDAPAFVMQVTWNLDQLVGYLRSWSSTALFIKTNRVDPVEELTKELLIVWGNSTQCHKISWPLALRVGVNIL